MLLPTSCSASRARTTSVMSSETASTSDQAPVGSSRGWNHGLEPDPSRWTSLWKVSPASAGAGSPASPVRGRGSRRSTPTCWLDDDAQTVQASTTRGTVQHPVRVHGPTGPRRCSPRPRPAAARPVIVGRFRHRGASGWRDDPLHVRLPRAPRAWSGPPSLARMLWTWLRTVLTLIPSSLGDRGVGLARCARHLQDLDSRGVSSEPTPRRSRLSLGSSRASSAGLTRTRRRRRPHGLDQLVDARGLRQEAGGAALDGLDEGASSTAADISTIASGARPLELRDRCTPGRRGGDGR